MKIDIDLDVFKALTLLLEHENDTMNAVIGRLLKLPAHGPPETPAVMADWFGYGVTLPVGTELRTNYKKQERIGTVRQDGLELDGRLFPSLSAAAIHVTGQNTNGWNFWKVRDSATRTFRPMQTLR